MTAARQALGKSAEDRAVEELRRRGYAVLARRYRTRHGEIDIICRDGGTVVFVEVKARTSGAFGPAAAAVTPFKQRRLASMAQDYLLRHRLTTCPCRFDVVALDDAAGEGRMEVFVNAFGA